MDQFWGAMIGALLGAAFGTLSTLLTFWITQRLSDRRAELAALSDLVMELHYRPSLLPVDPMRLKPSAQLKVEVQHRLNTAESMRSRVKKTRRNLPPGARAFKTIGTMQAALNVFIESIEQDATGLHIHSEHLRDALTKAVAQLHRERPDVPNLVPGAGAEAVARHAKL